MCNLKLNPCCTDIDETHERYDDRDNMIALPSCGLSSIISERSSDVISIVEDKDPSVVWFSRTSPSMTRGVICWDQFPGRFTFTAIEEPEAVRLYQGLFDNSLPVRHRRFYSPS